MSDRTQSSSPFSEKTLLDRPTGKTFRTCRLWLNVLSIVAFLISIASIAGSFIVLSVFVRYLARANALLIDTGAGDALRDHPRPSVEELIHYQSQLSIAAGQGIMVVAALVALSALGTLSALVLIQLYNRRISRRIDAGLSKLSNQMRSQGASGPESGLSDPLPELARQGVAAPARDETSDGTLRKRQPCWPRRRLFIALALALLLISLAAIASSSISSIIQQQTWLHDDSLLVQRMKSEPTPPRLARTTYFRE